MLAMPLTEKTRYAQIEKEMLAIVFSLQRFVIVSHYDWSSEGVLMELLETILKKPLSCAPCRLQGMMMRLQKYNIDVHYECEARMYIADLLSQVYLPEVG